MLETLQNFEQSAGDLRPVVLVVPGVILLLLGLFVWLGGLGLKRLVLAAIGVIIGAALGYFIVGKTAVSAAILAGVLGLVAIVAQRFFVAAVLGALVLFVGLFIFANVYGEVDEDGMTLAENIASRIPTETVKDSAAKIREMVGEVLSAMWSTLADVPTQWLAAVIAAVIAIVIAGTFLRRVAAALCCSMVGTTMIFIGLGLLLVQKGSAPFSRMIGSGAFYGTIFAAMTLFGTVEQCLLWWRADDKGKAAGAASREGDRK